MIIRNRFSKKFNEIKAAADKPQEVLNMGHKKSLKIKPSTAAVYLSVFALIVVMVFTSYQTPKKSSQVVNARSVTSISTVSVDDVVAVNIASSVAEAANLPIANNIANLALSTQVQSDYLQASSTPMVIGSTAVGRSIIDYTVASGDTMDSLVAKFGVSKDTIKWANNLTYDTLSEGKELKILPIDGIIYDVKDGDTIDSIADKYIVDKDRLVLYNDLDISGLTVGSKIILPNATLPSDERPGYITPVVNYYVRSGTDGNRYAAGNCTWYAYERRAQLGKPVGSFWGNANTWGMSAAGTGYSVDNAPSAGAVMVDESGWYGHVAIVESVSENGDVYISEMNNYAYGGWNIVSNRTVSAGQATLYKYIH